MANVVLTSSNISDNSTITSIQSAVSTNTTDIASNLTDINTNATDIVSNSGNISANTTAIQQIAMMLVPSYAAFYGTSTQTVTDTEVTHVLGDLPTPIATADITVASNTVTIVNSGLYEISFCVAFGSPDSLGADQRSTVKTYVKINNVEYTPILCQAYMRENSGDVNGQSNDPTFAVTIASGDTITLNSIIVDEVTSVTATNAYIYVRKVLGTT